MGDKTPTYLSSKPAPARSHQWKKKRACFVLLYFFHLLFVFVEKKRLEKIVTKESSHQSSKLVITVLYTTPALT